MFNNPRPPLFVAAIALAAFLSAKAQAVNHLESSNGDLSGNPSAPTSLGTLGLGSNIISATFGGGDYDLISFTVGQFHQLSAIHLNSYHGPNVSFSGIQTGSVWTAGLGGAVDPTHLLGWTHFGRPHNLTDILDNYGQGGFGATGFTPPLPAGAYTMEFQDTGAAVTASLSLYVIELPPIPGDVNGDRAVTADDYNIWLSHYGRPGPRSDGNLNGDSRITGADYTVWADNFTPSGPAPSSPVPEPGTFLSCLLALACTVAAVRPEHKRDARATP